MNGKATKYRNACFVLTLGAKQIQSMGKSLVTKTSISGVFTLIVM